MKRATDRLHFHVGGFEHVPPPARWKRSPVSGTTLLHQVLGTSATTITRYRPSRAPPPRCRLDEPNRRPLYHGWGSGFRQKCLIRERPRGPPNAAASCERFSTRRNAYRSSGPETFCTCWYESSLKPGRVETKIVLPRVPKVPKGPGQGAFSYPHSIHIGERYATTRQEQLSCLAGSSSHLIERESGICPDASPPCASFRNITTCRTNVCPSARASSYLVLQDSARENAT